MMSPDDFDGRFRVGFNRLGWWIGYFMGVECLQAIYFHADQNWHERMSPDKFFPTKQAALDAFFNKYPDCEIVDESADLHVILKK